MNLYKITSEKTSSLTSEKTSSLTSEKTSSLTSEKTSSLNGDVHRKNIGGFMPKKNKIVKEEIVDVKEPEKKEPTIHEELVEINAILKEMLELFKDIEYNTHDRTRFLEWKEITMISLDKVKKYCPVHYKEIKNYEQALNDKDHLWECHHINGEFWSRDWLIANNMYYNRTDPFEFVFLTKEEHTSRHHKGKVVSEETINKLKKARKYQAEPMLGKHHSDESKERIRKALKKPKSEFGKKYFEHYGLTKNDNHKLYNHEFHYYKSYGRCSWEV